MREASARFVHPAILHGLDLQRRLQAGQTPDLDTEQAILKNLLLRVEASCDYRELRPELIESAGGTALTERVETGIAQKTIDIRYALVCWLDEMFCRDTDWGRRWNEQKLEMELYGSNDRAWRFWQQARLAQARPGDDALEVFYLCVMLGFRGQYREDEEALQTWTTNAAHRLGKVDELSWPYASEIQSPTYMPPLRGKQRRRQMLMVAWVSLLFAAPLLAFVLVQRLGQ